MASTVRALPSRGALGCSGPLIALLILLTLPLLLLSFFSTQWAAPVPQAPATVGAPLSCDKAPPAGGAELPSRRPAAALGWQAGEHVNADSGYTFSLPYHAVGKGIVSYGDTRRLRRVLGRLLAGEAVSAATVGGSVTWGSATEKGREDYPSRLFAWLRSTFPSANHTLVNSAVPGTPSTYMALCLAWHVPEDVDLVVLEYNINDRGEPGDTAVRRSHERMVRRLLALPRRPAVVELVVMRWPSEDPAREDPGPWPYAQGGGDELGRLAQYYHLPWLSTRSLMWDESYTGHPGGPAVPQSQWMADQDHPNGALGHAFLADMLVGLLSRVAEDVTLRPLGPADEEGLGALPSPMFQGNYGLTSNTCFMGPLFHALVTSAEGWEWVNEGRGGKEKWGLVSTQPGSVARVVLSTEESSDGGGTAGPATVVITFLRSYEHMGKMRVECGGGCGCEAAVIQGHSELRESQTAVQAISVTRAGNHMPGTIIPSFSALPVGLVQEIMSRLSLNEQGRAACISKLCASAVLQLAPALAFHVTAGDAQSVQRLLQKPGARLGLDHPSCEGGWTPLQTAVDYDDLVVVVALLRAGASPVARSLGGLTPLGIAAALGRASMVATLLAAGAAVEAEPGEEGLRPLHMAAQNGHALAAELLLAGGAALEAEDKRGQRPLHLAANFGHTAAVEALLAAGADVEAKGEDGWRPLHLAAQDGHASTVEALLAGGAELEAETMEGTRALHIAAGNGRTSAVEVLVAAGAALDAATLSGARPLHLALFTGRTSTVEALLAAGAPLETGGSGGFPALHYAAERGDVSSIQALVAAGAPLEAVDKYGRSALHYAADRGHALAAELLLAAGAALEAASEDGRRALHLAAGNGHAATVTVLLAAGAALEAVDDVGCRALHYASADGHLAVVESFIAAGAALEAEGEGGWRPLHLAAQKGHASTVAALLAAGAALDTVDNYGRLALHAAAVHGHTSTVEVLLAAGVALEAEAEGGLRALHCAAENGHASTVEALLAAGAALEAAHEKGWRPLHFAAGNGRASTVEALLAAGAELEAEHNAGGWRPLHYAAAKGHTSTVKALLAGGAALEAANIGGRRALHLAAQNGHTSIVEALLAAGAELEAVTMTGESALQLAESRGHSGAADVILAAGALRSVAARGASGGR